MASNLKGQRTAAKTVCSTSCLHFLFCLFVFVNHGTSKVDYNLSEADKRLQRASSCFHAGLSHRCVGRLLGMLTSPKLPKPWSYSVWCHDKAAAVVFVKMILVMYGLLVHDRPVKRVWKVWSEKQANLPPPLWLPCVLLADGSETEASIKTTPPGWRATPPGRFLLFFKTEKVPCLCPNPYPYSFSSGILFFF